MMEIIINILIGIIVVGLLITIGYIVIYFIGWLYYKYRKITPYKNDEIISMGMVLSILIFGSIFALIGIYLIGEGISNSIKWE